MLCCSGAKPSDLHAEVLPCTVTEPKGLHFCGSPAFWTCMRTLCAMQPCMDSAGGQCAALLHQMPSGAAVKAPGGHQAVA